jgi:hypothetical protein
VPQTSLISAPPSGALTVSFNVLMLKSFALETAQVAELVDALVSGTSA